MPQNTNARVIISASRYSYSMSERTNERTDYIINILIISFNQWQKASPWRRREENLKKKKK